MPPIRNTRSSPRRPSPPKDFKVQESEDDQPELYEPCFRDASSLALTCRSSYIQSLPPWEIIVPKRLRHIIPPDPRPPPLRLQDFEVSKTLGSGGYGKVLLAKTCRKEHRLDKPGSVLALKFIRSRDVRAGDIRHPREKDFERLSLAALPWNPWVNNLYGAFFDYRNLYLALDYVQGVDLHSIIYKHGPIPRKTAAFYFANIICGLEFLHEQGVSHNDLKPDNILVGADGYLVFADFSTGKRMHLDIERLDRDDFLAGTYYYLAPEQLDPQFQTGVMAQSIDFWQVGTILYEMICRRKVFPCKNELQARHHITRCEWTWPSDVRPGKKLDDLVKGLLTKDAGDRLGLRESEGEIEEIKRHPWLAHVDWNKMHRRVYLAPRTPTMPDPETTRHKQPLPGPRECPGVRIITPKPYLRFDEWDQ